MDTSKLRRVPLFSEFNNTDLQALADVVLMRQVPQDAVILHADEEGDALFIILKGRVTVTMNSEDGKSVILAILKDGDFFGEMSLLDGKSRSATVTATEPTELILLRRPDFLACLETHPEITEKLLVTLAIRLRRTNRQVESLALLNAYGRVAGVLLQLAEDEGVRAEDGTITIQARPILREIANMAGTTRETVSRVFTDLERRGYIHRDELTVVIHNPDRLQDDFFFLP